MAQRNSDARNTMLAMRRMEQQSRMKNGFQTPRWGKDAVPRRNDGSVISPAREALRMASKVNKSA